MTAQQLAQTLLYWTNNLNESDETSNSGFYKEKYNNLLDKLKAVSEVGVDLALGDLCDCGCHFSDFAYRGGKDCAQCHQNHED